jgi:enoyl-CoA hydratase/carnithine racemase
MNVEIIQDISAIILTGAGEAFCAGGDKANLGANNKIDPLETKNHFWDHFQRVAKRTALIEKPIVAAVNGMATGAGMDMSLHCDIRFASKNAIFRASYAAFGFSTWKRRYIYFLPRIVGTSKPLNCFGQLM